MLMLRAKHNLELQRKEKEKTYDTKWRSKYVKSQRI